MSTSTQPSVLRVHRVVSAAAPPLAASSERRTPNLSWASSALQALLVALAAAPADAAVAEASNALPYAFLAGLALILLGIAALMLKHRRRGQRREAWSEVESELWGVLDVSPFAQWVCTEPELRIVWANAVARGSYGELAAVGASLAELRLTGLRNSASGEACSLERLSDRAVGDDSVWCARLESSSGQLLPIELRVRRVRFMQRSAVLVTLLSAAERHALENHVAVLEGRIRDLARGSPIGLWELDLETGCIRGGEELEVQLGLLPGAFPSTFDDLLDWVMAADRQALSVAIERAVAGRDSAEVECELASGNRHVRIEAFPRSVEAGDARLRGRISDISDLKRMERSLRESEARFRAVVDGLPDAVLLVAAGGAVDYANDAALQLWGAQQPSELIGRALGDLVEAQPLDPDDPDEAGAVFKRRLCSGLDGQHFTAAVAQTALVLQSSDASLVVLRAQERSERVAEKLQQANRRLRQLSNHMVTLQERERRKLARDLHDEVGQALTAILMHIDLLARKSDQPVSRDRIDKLRGVVEASVQQVRGMLQELRPPQLDELGLGSALRAQLDRIDHSENLTLTLDCPLLEPRPDPRIESIAFRLVQECLTNLIKHAGAQQASVRVRVLRESGQLRLDIIDDGRGFDVALVSSGAGQGGHGLGLLSMRERVQLVGGELSIQSVHGLGTQVTATLPLQPPGDLEND